MLNFLGTVAGNILSLPGILGLALGMMTRNIALAAALGVLVGVAETLIFAGFQLAHIDMFELVIAICVGIVAATVGCFIRRIGATV